MRFRLWVFTEGGHHLGRRKPVLGGGCLHRHRHQLSDQLCPRPFGRRPRGVGAPVGRQTPGRRWRPPEGAGPRGDPLQGTGATLLEAMFFDDK